jgi:hypothetical protein
MVDTCRDGATKEDAKMALNDTQFEKANNKVDAEVSQARKSGDESRKAAAKALSAGWEAVLALPERTFDNRVARLAAMEAFAVANGLVTL